DCGASPRTTWACTLITSPSWSNDRWAITDPHHEGPGGDPSPPGPVPLSADLPGDPPRQLLVLLGVDLRRLGPLVAHARRRPLHPVALAHLGPAGMPHLQDRPGRHPGTATGSPHRLLEGVHGVARAGHPLWYRLPPATQLRRRPLRPPPLAPPG